MALVVEMEKQARLFKKRQQRHNRETNARKDQFISDYVRHKHYNIYSQAEEFYHTLKAIYTNKHDLKKTVEYITWKRQTSIDIKYKDNMVLKIPLFDQASKTTINSETVETGSSEDDHHLQEFVEQTANMIDSEVREINTDEDDHHLQEFVEQTANIIDSEVREIIDEINTGETLLETLDEGYVAAVEITTSEEDIVPTIHEEIPTELLQEIINDLKTDPYLKDMLTDFETLGMDIDIDHRHTLEDELRDYEGM